MYLYGYFSSVYFQPFISLAVRCIQVDNVTDTYTHALMAYAMALYKPSSRFTEIIINQLFHKAIKQGIKINLKLIN